MNFRSFQFSFLLYFCIVFFVTCVHFYSRILLILFCSTGYIGEFEYVDDHRSGKIVVELNGRLNKCGVISPRFDVGVKDIEPWTARLLPSRQVSMKPPC